MTVQEGSRQVGGKEKLSEERGKRSKGYVPFNRFSCAQQFSLVKFS